MPLLPYLSIQQKKSTSSNTLYIFQRVFKKIHMPFLIFKIEILFTYSEEVKWRKVAQLCPTLPPHALYNPWNSLGQNTGEVSLFLLQGIFPIQGSKPGLPYWEQILYQLSHKEAHTSSCTWVVLNSIVTRLFLSFPKLILITEFRQKGNYFQNSWLPQMI